MRFFGQGLPPADEFLFKRYFAERRGGFFIEAGAFDGALDSMCRFFEESMGWSGINLEPVPHLYTQLCANRPGATNLRLALSNKCEHLRFTQAIHPVHHGNFGNGSISHAPEHLEQLKNSGCTFEEFEVQTITLSELMAIHAPGVRSIDLFALDVEGHELSVLESLNGLPRELHPRILCAEYPHVGLENLAGFLNSFGYKLDGVIPNAASSMNNAIFTRAS